MSRVLGDAFTEVTRVKREDWWWADRKERAF